MIDQEKFGKFIAQLRKEANLTQEELAARIIVGREAVSKWERGVGLPGHELLLALSKEFNVTVNELLYGERLTKTNEEEIEVVPYKWIDVISAKLYNWKKKFIVTIIIAAIIYLISCILFNYNSFKIYSTYTNDGDFTIKPGLIVRYHNRMYFKFGNIVNHIDEDIKNTNLYYGNDDKRVKIISGSILEDVVLDIKEIEKVTNKDIKEVLDNLYVEIITVSKTEEYKIETDINFKTNKFSKTSKIDSEEYSENIETQLNDSSELDKIKSKFKLKDGEYVYEFKYKDKKYRCMFVDNSVQMEIKNAFFVFRIDSNKINITSDDKRIVYNVNNKTCEVGDCKKYKNEINALLNKVIN